MKFTYEQLEDGDGWLTSYEELDLSVVTASKEAGTVTMLAVIERICTNMLGYYGRILGQAQEAAGVLAAARSKEQH